MKTLTDASLVGMTLTLLFSLFFSQPSTSDEKMQIHIKGEKRAADIPTAI